MCFWGGNSNAQMGPAAALRLVRLMFAVERGAIVSMSTAIPMPGRLDVVRKVRLVRDLSAVTPRTGIVPVLAPPMGDAVYLGSGARVLDVSAGKLKAITKMVTHI